MKQPSAYLLFLPCLLAPTALAQTTVGGGTCSSMSLNAVYAVSITARQITASGAYTGVFQSNGSATFDGESAVTITLTANTGQTVGKPITWSGAYSVQANCAGVINITSGPTLNVAVYNQGVDFLLSGSDSSYTYAGAGITQPATACTAGSFSGVYAFSGTGFALTGGAVSGAENSAGLLQFDGVSAITANLTLVPGGAAASTLTLTGSYSISSSSNCLGSATLSDTAGNSYSMLISIYNNTPANGGAYVDVTLGSKFLISGTAHATYGQPAPSAAVLTPGDQPMVGAFLTPVAGSASVGGRA